MMDQVRQLQKVFFIEADKHDAQVALADAVRVFGQLSLRCDNLKLSAEISGKINEFEKMCNVDNHGYSVYTRSVQEFREVINDVVGGVELMATDLKAGMNQVDAATQSLDEKQHQLAQLSKWSDASSFDRKCAEYAIGPLLKFCRHYPWIVKMETSVSKDYVPDQDLISAVDMIRKKDDSKPILVWLIGEDKTTILLALAAAAHELLAPLAENCISRFRKSMLTRATMLEKSLVDIDDDDEFHKSLNAGKLGKIREARQKCKEAIDGFNKLVARPEEDDQKLLIKAGQLTELAKLQTIRWSVLSFVLHPEIEASTSAGMDLRQQLGKVWAAGNSGEDVEKYLGESFVSMLAKIIKKDKKTQEKNKTDASTTAAESVPPTPSSVPSGKHRKVGKGAKSSGLVDVCSAWGLTCNAG